MNFEHYQLTLLDHPNKTVSVRLNEKNGTALKKERRKLYVIYYEKEILYVGEANSSLMTRFQRSCTSFNYHVINGNSRNGYKGYKWLNAINRQRNLRVLTLIFDETKDNDREFVEAVEGELVFLIRKELNYWPKFQHEIHFRNRPGAFEVAKLIFRKLPTKAENK